MWAAIGLYPVSGSTDFVLLAPSFEKISITHPRGTLSVVVHNFDPNGWNIAKVAINGKPVDLYYAVIDWKEWAMGDTTIEYWMTP